MESSLPISVIIPVYNRQDMLQRSLSSALEQTHPPQEILVIGDGCKDDSLAVARELRANHPRGSLIRIFSQPNVGVSAARNLGIHASHAPWIAFLDSDDEWFPEKLEMQWQYVEEHPEVALVHNDEIWIRNGRRVNPKHKHKKQGGHIYTSCLPLCCISPSCALMRRDVLAEFECFDTEFAVCEDYKLWLNLCAKYEIGYIDQPLIRKYGGHSDQLSQKYFAMDWYRVKALSQILSSQELSPAEREETLQTLTEKKRVLSLGAMKHRNFILQWQLDYGVTAYS